MSLERDFYEERRRRWRRSAFWRGFLIASGIALICIGIYVATGAPGYPSGRHIARFSIEGTIYDDPAREALLKDMAENEDVAALILRITSPGGTTTGAEVLYEAIRDVAETKPVVAVLGEVAASGGYIAAIAADHVIARGNSITGSIGVILEYPNISDLLDEIGVEMETVRTSSVKGGPSPFRDPTPESRAAQEAMIEDAYQWFRGLVSERRNLTGSGLDSVADGRVFTGRQAVTNKLVDAIGGEDDALIHLESLNPELADLNVKTWVLEAEDDGFGNLLGKISKNSLLIQRITGNSVPSLTSKY